VGYGHYRDEIVVFSIKALLLSKERSSKVRSKTSFANSAASDTMPAPQTIQLNFLELRRFHRMSRWRDGLLLFLPLTAASAEKGSRMTLCLRISAGRYSGS
jgi:hypothetical protein